VGPTQVPAQWVQGALTPGVKRQRREADDLLPYSVEVNNAWSHTSIPPIRLHGVVLALSTGTHLPSTFTFTFTVSYIIGLGCPSLFLFRTVCT